MTVENGVLQLRIGLRWEARILLSSIAFAGAPEPFNHSLNESPSGSAPLRVGVIGSPNVVLRFTEPQTLRPIFGRERRTTAMALLVDDPVAFIAALQAQEQGPQSGVHQSS